MTVMFVLPMLVMLLPFQGTVLVDLVGGLSWGSCAPHAQANINSWDLAGSETGKNWFCWIFLGQYNTFAKNRLVFLVQYSAFVNFLAKVLSAVLSQKTKKKLSFEDLAGSETGKD